jgi:hypothetical protein
VTASFSSLFNASASLLPGNEQRILTSAENREHDDELEEQISHK